MRFAILGISHETNTFSSVPADYASFEAEGILRGQEIEDEFGGSEATAAGFLQAARELGFEGVPLIHARTEPDRHHHQRRVRPHRGRDDRPAKRKRSVGTVCCWRTTARLCRRSTRTWTARWRDVCVSWLGPTCRLGIALDMHGNISKEAVRHTTAMTIYRSNPHLDARERARECAEIIFRTAKGEIAPVQWLEMPPMYINIVKQFHRRGADEVGRRRLRFMPWKTRGLSPLGSREGYPYADVKQMGMSFLAIADGDLDLAREKAVWMAERAWERRAEMHIHVPSVREALEMAESHADANPGSGPVVLMDVGDNIGGGSSADSTYILEEAKRMGVRRFLQSLYDPEAVGQCVEAGVGGEVSIEVGAKTDDLHGKPVAVTGRVTRLSDGKYEDTRPTHGGYRFFDGGTTAVLETSDDHTLVLTSKRDGKYVTGADVLGGNLAGEVPGGCGEGRRVAPPRVSADSVAGSSW